MNGRYEFFAGQSEVADQPVACATSTQLFITFFCSVAFTFEWQPSWRLIFNEVGAGQEFVAEQLGRIEIVFGYVATAAAVAELRAGIGFMTEVGVAAGVDEGELQEVDPRHKMSPNTVIFIRLGIPNSSKWIKDCQQLVGNPSMAQTIPMSYRACKLFYK